MIASFNIPVAMACIVLFLACMSASAQQHDRPNILWITSEDNSPMLGCYGDEFATTPNLDKLAAKGFRYTHAYANAPVCAPTRNTIITGIYANSGGHEHMRSFYKKSDTVKLYPEYLKEAGYYCTNNQKEDFNIYPEQTQNVWDELGGSAHYKNRPKGQPFFAIFNSTITHESSLHQTVSATLLRHQPEDVNLPPYHPDTPEIRHDWAQYYDKVEDMDAWVGKILKELEESGEAENTIVFYYADHGGALARSKRFVYETGTRVPLIVHLPEKYKHWYPVEKPGSEVNRLVSFVDLAPTLLSLVGKQIPEYLQGNAFLGDQKTKDPEYAFMFRGRMDERYDLSRAVRDHKYRYIKNYMPFRIYGQHIEYLWRAPSIRSWEAACKSGKCDETQSRFWNSKPIEELYDTENDPWEVNNLADDPDYEGVLERMRAANRAWLMEIRDPGFIPEAELAKLTENTSAYDYMRSSDIDLASWIEAAEEASHPQADPDRLAEYLNSEDVTVRYWGATGFLTLGEKAKPYLQNLKHALADPSPNVVAVAAEALYQLGEPDVAKRALIKTLKDPNLYARTHALNAIDAIGEKSTDVQHAVLDLVEGKGRMEGNDYDLRAALGLLGKWGIDRDE